MHVNRLDLNGSTPASQVSTKPRDSQYSVLRDLLLCREKDDYGNIDSTISVVFKCESLEDSYGAAAQYLSRFTHSYRAADLLSYEELLKVAKEGENLWDSSCAFEVFLASAVCVFLKTCIYRFGDSGAFSDALNTIII